MRIAIQPSIIGRRYIIQSPLGAGGMGAVYRATDRLTGQAVALKRVAPDDQQIGSTGDSQDYRLALAQEFKVLASLRHPHIISVLDYGFDEQRHPYFTMELLEDARPIIEAGIDLPINEKVRLLVQMLQALAYLHRRGIIHRDLKPRNVLVTGGQVKVLDFGLSIVGKQHSDDSNAMTGGTLAYMAPEVLMGGDADASADLYAVGIIAYELFAGHHPFKDVAALVNSILYAVPDMDALDVSPMLSLAVGRLLAKSRQSRYTGAAQVIEEFSNAIQQPELAQETAATRESYLQAARLVGRDRELQQLSDALTLAVDGHGSSWLIAGESGVGKSRFVDELRTLAMTRGALVLRGQGIIEGGSPYHLWRPALRWLALLTDLDDERLALLKPLIPDLDALLERALPDAPELSPQAAQSRLLSVIEELFRRQSGPVVLILEDLHWAQDSLAVLSRLNTIVSGQPLLIIGSFRDDEAPDLPSRLPGMKLLKLERLNEKAIAELSEAMLGESGRQEQVVDLLRRETEGNVFFLVEVVRVLAQEAGNLERIGMVTLPAQMFVGGVQHVIQQRLSRLPADALPLLRFAAVMGRQLDLDVLQKVESPMPLERWLQVCLDAAVLEVLEARWRFAHDKLRDGVLADLRPEPRKRLHQNVAEALERVYTGQPEQIALLAYHFGKAENAAKELIYTRKAGELSLRSGAYREAINSLERALELVDSINPPDKTGQNIQLKRQMAEAHLGLGEYAEARRLYQENLDAARASNDKRATAEALRSVGDVASALAEHAEAIAHYQEALVIYREINDQSGISKSLNSLGNVAYDAGSVDEARKLYQESLSISRASGSQWGMAGSIATTHEMERVRLDENDTVTKTLETLRAVHAEGDTRATLEALTDTARALITAGKTGRALELLSLIIHHPKTDDTLQDKVEPLLMEAEARLDGHTVIQHWERGKALSLDAAVQELAAR
jgi:serine/threonine protein kinase/tetratricopeptide (TPR) repeat protein